MFTNLIEKRLSMGKIEYGSVYKFLVSFGVILVFFPFVALYLLATGEVKPISQSEMSSISPYSVTMLEWKQYYMYVCRDILPYLGGASFALGVIILVWGFLRWQKNQSLEDSNLEMENKIKGLSFTERVTKTEKKLEAQDMPQESDDLASAEESGQGGNQENAEPAGESGEDGAQEPAETPEGLGQGGNQENAEPAGESVGDGAREPIETPEGLGQGDNQENAGQSGESGEDGAREPIEPPEGLGQGDNQENAGQSGESGEDGAQESTEIPEEPELRSDRGNAKLNMMTANISCIEKAPGKVRRFERLYRYLEIEDQSFEYLKRRGIISFDEYSLKRNVKIGVFEYDAIAVSKEDNIDLLFEIKYWPTIPNSNSVNFAIQRLKKSAEFYEWHMKRNFKIRLVVVTRKELEAAAQERAFSAIFKTLPGMIELTIIDEKELL